MRSLVLVVDFVDCWLALKYIKHKSQLSIARNHIIVKVTIARCATIGVKAWTLHSDRLAGMHVHQSNIPTLGHMELSNLKYGRPLLLELFRVFEFFAVIIKRLPVNRSPILSITSPATLLDDFIIQYFDVLHCILHGISSIILHIGRISKDVEGVCYILALIDFCEEFLERLALFELLDLRLTIFLQGVGGPLLIQ